MSGIWIMAALTLAAVVAVWGGLMWYWTRHDARYLLPFALALPLSAIANLAIKGPVAEWASRATGIVARLTLGTPLWFLLFALLLAPVVEEALKATPMLVPRVRALLSEPSGPLLAGMAIGIGFGTGEIVMIAYGVARSPVYAGIPWYQFTGFFTERLVVCFFHGTMTGLMLLLASRGHRALGYLAAVGMHAFVNISALAYQIGALGTVASGIAFSISIVGSVVVFEWMRRSTLRAARAADPARAGEVVYWRRGD